MPSKKLKSRIPRFHPWKDAQNCSESALRALALGLATELRAGDRVVLEGPMGAGKTTFARTLLEGIGVVQPPEGSPTFAIAHEYESAQTDGVVHIDFYRLRHETEIDDAGIPSYFWERPGLVICEWLSLWPEFERSVLGSGRIFRVKLGIVSETERSVEIQRT